MRADPRQSNAGPSQARRPWRTSLWAIAAVLLLAASPVPTSEELAARRERIAGMDAAGQQDLLRKLDRFTALPPEEQERLRDLQAAINADPNAERLMTILERYHEWLKTITPSQRARLAELPARQRVEEIERIVRSQRDAQRLELLTEKDTREIRNWVEKLVEEHRDELVAGLPGRYRTWYDRQTDKSSKQFTLMFPLFGYSREGQVNSKVTAEDIDRLAKELSDGARAELDKAQSLDDKRKLVGGWLFSSMRRNWQRGRRSNPVLTEELLQYLQNDVPAADRERLLKLPREEMLHEVRKRYFERGFGDRGFGEREGGRPHREDGRPNFERRKRDEPPSRAEASGRGSK